MQIIAPKYIVIKFIARSGLAMHRALIICLCLFKYLLIALFPCRKSDRHATSDCMTMEKERGISITSSVMQFHRNGKVVNLLDTPGHEDFSEDTYRT